MTAPKITRKEVIAMNRNACSIKGVLDEVRIKIDMLNAELKVILWHQ